MRRKIRPFLLFIVSIVSVVFTSWGSSYAEPIKFNYHEIPFGKPIGFVFDLVKGADIVQKDSANIEFLLQYQGFLEKYFNNGFYTASGQGAELSSQITRVYRVSYKEWDDIHWVDLYFTKGFKAKDADYRLFMVIKEERNPSVTGSYDDVFKSYVKSVVDVLKNSPETFTYQYKTSSLEKAEPAAVGEWQLATMKIYLLVHNEGTSSGSPLIIYRNNQGWQQYLSALDKADQDRKAEIERKIKRNF